MRIAVTGSAGFMASHIVDALLLDGHEVIGLDDLSGGFVENVPRHPEHTFYPVDLSDAIETKRIFEKCQPEILYHLAANAREGASFFDPLDVTRRNLFAYMSTLEACIATGKLKKVVFFSSMSRWGDQMPPFTEDLPPKPIDPYAANKVAAEEITKQLAGAHGFDYTIIIPRNVYGERQSMRDRFRNVLAIWANQILRHEPVTVFGDGEQVRSFSYIQNSLPCYLKCLIGSSGETVSIGGMRPVTINQAVEMFIHQFQEYDPEVVHLPDRHGEAKQAWAGVEKSVRLLGYHEGISMEEGFARMAAWAKSRGPQPWNYEHQLALVNELVPKTWRDQPPMVT